MKMMEVNKQNDIVIETVIPVKKKKMKQAQLPFQTKSPVQSPGVVSKKKRKLTSPVEHKSPKALKIEKKNLSKDDVNSESDSVPVDAKKKNIDSVELVDLEIENVKENTMTNKLDTINKNVTPKRTSIGQKKLERQEKLKSSPLTKFLQKNDKKEDTLNENTMKSLREESNESNEKSAKGAAETDKNISQSTSNSNNELEDSVSKVEDNSLCQSDSDVELLSSDNEEKDDQTKSTDTGASDSAQILKTPKMDKTKQKKLTPKQQEKKLLSAKKKEERQRQKMEKERKLKEERENRLREKEERRKEKEEKEKAEKEQRMLEKKMKEQKKQFEIEQKQKEKLAKEEERKKREEAKEEERKKREEEKLEAERRKQKAASNFTSFFVAKKLEKSIEEENATKVKNFMPFEVKADMKVASICRRILEEEEKLLLDKKCSEGNTRLSDLYLGEIKDKRIVPRKSSKTWPYEAKDDVVVLDEENDGSTNIVSQDIVVEKQRSKLLQFAENQRPPYWGTWRKRSQNINPRRPFSKDTKWFNYEVDSDDEWEEEEPGESLHGSDDEKDEENAEDNEYDVDNEFMVPHGYLSDEEVGADEDDKEDMSPETQKFKLKVLGEEFESERKSRTSKLKPKILGCIWRGADNKFAANVAQRAVDFLSAREAWVRQIPVVLPTTSENEANAAGECSTPTQQPATSSKKSRVPEEVVPHLIRLIHGNTHNSRFLVNEFMAYWSKQDHKPHQKWISKASLARKIREIGKWMTCPEEGPMYTKTCWYVPKEIRKKYNEWDKCMLRK
ncbi:unnamed protein product [Xylocopa violacea]|uniref:Chromatin assembly factor 1 subunit A n=1 Tax=Xylocopa violacea TaxID=135666 RepID=A0ABP1P0K8_XYLVO